MAGFSAQNLTRVIHTLTGENIERPLRDWCVHLEAIEINSESQTLSVRLDHPNLETVFPKTVLTQLQEWVPTIASGLKDYNVVLSPTSSYQSLNINPGYKLDDLLVGSFNRLALSAAKSIAAMQTPEFSPFFIHGASGRGKTHLLHGIGNLWMKKNPEQSVCLYQADLFLHHFFQAIQKNEQVEFRNSLRKNRLFLFDDIHQLQSHPNMTNEFIALFDLLHDDGIQFIFTSLVAPQFLEHIPDQLRSRFQWGLCIELEDPEQSVKEQLLQRKANELSIQLSQEINQYLINHLHGNIREIEGVLHNIHGRIQLLNQEPTLALVQQLIQYHTTQSHHMVTSEEIQNQVCEFFNVNKSDLISKSRSRNIAFPRQVGMYLTKSLTKSSLEQIGKEYGGRDHSTIKHGCEKIERLLNSDMSLRKIIDQMKQGLLLQKA